VNHRLRHALDNLLDGADYLFEIDDDLGRKRIGRWRYPPTSKLLGARRRPRPEPFRYLSDLLVFQQSPDQLGPRILPCVVVQRPR